MKFSIITPVYNRADCIARCIESVINQTPNEAEVEHIIVDDGSTDDTARTIQKYASEYPHIHFVAFTHNRGTNAARNAAIAIANGDFCIILDSDDYFVNDAILFITTTIRKHIEYNHFLFAPNDMQPKYKQNPLLDIAQRAITYQNFLTGEVGGDFIHVIKTPILRKYPFDETLRIYEGVFFMRFYRESQKMLFTNRVVTIRERSRKDSVTRTTIRTSKDIIIRKTIATKLYIQWYGNDLKKYGYTDKLYQNYQSLLENLLLLEDYKKAGSIINNDLPSPKPIYKIIYHFRLGKVFRVALAIYLKIKYNILNKKLK